MVDSNSEDSGHKDPGKAASNAAARLSELLSTPLDARKPSEPGIKATGPSQDAAGSTAAEGSVPSSDPPVASAPPEGASGAKDTEIPPAFPPVPLDPSDPPQPQTQVAEPEPTPAERVTEPPTVTGIHPPEPAVAVETSSGPKRPEPWPSWPPPAASDRLDRDDGRPLDPSASRVIAKVRRLMLVSSALTALAVAAVFGVIGYRVFTSGGRLDGPAPAATQMSLTLPAGAKILQTAVAEDRIVLTLGIGGSVEIRTYDLKTLKPLGLLNFSRVP